MFLKLLSRALLALGLILPVPAPAAPPIETYGRLPGFEMAAISPSGERIALIGIVNDQRRLIVIDGSLKLLLTSQLSDQKVRTIAWAGNDRVLLRISATTFLGPDFTTSRAELTTMMVVPIEGGKPWLIFENNTMITGGIRGFFGLTQREGRIYGYFGGITLEQSRAGGELISTSPKLYEVDLETRRARLLSERARYDPGYRDWVVGADGKVAAILDFASAGGKWTIQTADRQPIASGIAPTGDVALIGLGRTADMIVYRTRGDDDVSWLFEQPLKGGAAIELLGDEAIAGLSYDDYDRRLIGYVRDRDIVEDHFFDQRRAKIMAATRKAFPGLTVRLISANADFTKLIVRTDGPGDPQTWWLVDIRTGGAEAIGTSYPMASSDVGPMRMLAYTASDGLRMGGVLTLPPGREAKGLPVIMMPHGGPASRDYPVFDYWAQAFASRGYAVFQPNFRGSTGFTQEFRAAGRGQWGRKMQTDISDGLAELVRQGIADPKRVCIVGASYGGYAALAGVTLQQGLYRCAVSVAGVADVARMYGTDIRESGNDATMRRALNEEVGSGRDLKTISPTNFAERADAPILLIHGIDDVVVRYDQSVAMANALKRAGKPFELVTLKGEDHWLSRSETRLAMLKAAIAFVEKHSPPDKAP